MRFVTTINPNGRYERQRECINSWHEYDVPIYALQLPHEVAKVNELFPDVTVVPASGKPDIWSKNTPSIDSLIDYGKRRDILLINSDIELTFQDHNEFVANFLLPPPNTIICGIRYDVNTNNKHSFNPYGIDVLRFTPEMLGLLPSTDFCLGVPGWDYWIPYYLKIRHKYRLKTHFSTKLVHMEHSERWNDADQKTAWKMIEKECGIERKRVTYWIQDNTGRARWNHQSSYGRTQKILRGSRTVYEA